MDFNKVREEITKAKMAMEASKRMVETNSISKKILDNANKLSSGAASRVLTGYKKNMGKAKKSKKSFKEERENDLLNELGLISKRKEGR